MSTDLIYPLGINQHFSMTWFSCLRLLAQALCLTGSDLNSAAKPWAIQYRTAQIVYSEFHEQVLPLHGPNIGIFNFYFRFFTDFYRFYLATIKICISLRSFFIVDENAWNAALFWGSYYSFRIFRYKSFYHGNLCININTLFNSLGTYLQCSNRKKKFNRIHIFQET